MGFASLVWRLDSDQLEIGSRRSFDNKAEFDGFADAGPDLIEGAGLGVTTGQLRDRRYVVAFTVPLNDDIELPLHARLLSDSTTPPVVSDD
jgi:hypothetical protein